eukprot:CAMPEP_0194514816 /NCGR_PEP_ID=MMETSP0253-20130528/47373_1 /TAXON_ID=2966 /ORGANISM="Noctiluca scintillans" /LENGTH=125 /DNA_ID=CAMNT_0039358513 /DNA_START=189 /DNA_END=566 /DNA_ORIENTATION=-
MFKEIPSQSWGKAVGSTSDGGDNPASFLRAAEDDAKAVASSLDAVLEEPLVICETIFGWPKLFWAVVCDIMAVAVIVMCVPLLLNVTRRRQPGQTIFQCTPWFWQVDAYPKLQFDEKMAIAGPSA